MKKAFCFTALLVGVIFLAGTTAVADCPDQKVLCESIWQVPGTPGMTFRFYFYAGTCWRWEWMACDFCQSLQDLASQCTRLDPVNCATDTCAACRTFAFPGGGSYDPRGPCYDVRGWKYPNLTPWP